MRLQPRRRFAHNVEIKIVHPRLVQHDMRKLRQPVFGVLHPSAAQDILRLRGVGLPERRLVDPAGFLQHPLAEAEGLEHLHRAAGDAVGLAAQQRAGFCSTMQVLMSGKADSWAAKVKPAGPQPTMSTSTSSGTAPDAPDAA
jgi:hypothetical protein